MSRHEKTQFFDDASSHWDERIPPIDGNPILESWLSKISLSDGDKALDFGCGTGRLIPRIWEKISPSGEIYAADFSQKMLNVCKAKYPAIPAKYLCATPQELTIPADYLDCIILLSMFPHFEEPVKDLSALASKLKPGKDLWIVHLDSRETLNAMHHKIGGAVAHDLIPDKNTMVKIIDSSSLDIISFIDKEDSYIIHCIKK